MTECNIYTLNFVTTEMKTASLSALLRRMPKRATMLAEDLLRPSNVHVLRGLIQLGRLRAANPDMNNCMKAVHVFHTYVFATLHFVLVCIPFRRGNETYL